ncbi:MAG: TetR/AcrR family transcriptional regulator [Devosiaceae bacterium]|nr:TetR/AcrR family transcriptional regulator [Devosiaceae bacterium MH13]
MPSASTAKVQPPDPVEVAEQIFLTHGYSGASLDDIARQSGTPRDSLDRQFGGKHGLFRAVVQRLCDKQARALSVTESV